jgi:hypothetical protein
MTIVPAIRLSPSDLAHLGNNVGPAIRQDHQHFHAINRSLAIHDEQCDVDELHDNFNHQHRSTR